MTVDCIVIDTRPQVAEPKKLEADLVITIQRLERGYAVAYFPVGVAGPFPVHFPLTRAEMVLKHIEMIQHHKPKTVVIDTGEEASDVAIHPGVVKLIIEGKLTAAELTLS